MNHEAHPTELLPAYALGILDPDEADRVEAHLASCPECRGEVAAYAEITDHLAFAAPEAPLPAGLRERLLAAARQTPDAEKAPEPRWWQRIIPSGLRQNTVGPSSRPAWQPLAVILVLLLVISNIVLWQRLRRLENQPPPTQQAIFLGGTDAAPEAGGVIVFDPDAQSGTLFVNGLAPLDPDQQYQLWLVYGEERDTGAIFSVEGTGINSIPITASQAWPIYSRFGITIEPAGGSPGPTGAGVLRSASPPEPDEG